jgi:hypothetical protein
MLFIQTAGTNWDLRELFGDRVYWAIIVGFPVALVGLVLYIRRQDRRRKMAGQPKAGS